MVPQGTGSATLVQDATDGKWGAKSPTGSVFLGAGSSFLMHNRVISFVFTFGAGVFVFAAIRDDPVYIQVNSNGTSHTFGIGNGSDRWDTVQRIDTTSAAGKRQVMTFLILEGSPRRLIVRCAGRTVDVTWVTNYVPLVAFTSLQLGGRTGVGNDADVTLHEVFLSSPTQVPATSTGVNAEYTRLCTKWGVTTV